MGGVARWQVVAAATLALTVRPLPPHLSFEWDTDADFLKELKYGRDDRDAIVRAN
jgi:hypothetical protein